VTKLLELQLQNVFPFKKATLDLDYEGVTVVKGLNKDDGPKASNAAGKSRLVGALPDLVLDESPTGKEDKKAGTKKKRKQAIRVRLQRGSHEYQITKTIGKGKSYEIVRDGKSINVRTVKYSQQKIQELFGFSTEDQFYTRFYIDGTIPHPLIVGSASRRQEYVVDLFDLKNIDSIRKLLNAELNAISKKAIEYKTVKRTLDELREDLLPKEKRVELKKRLEHLKSKQERLSEDLKASQHISQLLTFERQNKQLLDKWKAFRPKGSSITEDIQIVRKKIGKIHADRDASEQWRAYDRSYESWWSSYEPVKKKLSKLNSDEETVRKRWMEVSEFKAMIKSQKVGSDPGDKPEEVDEPKHSYDDCKLKVHQFREELEHAKHFKSGKCPTCGSKVKARSTEDIGADLRKWVNRINQCERHESYTKKLETWKQRRSDYEETKRVVSDLERKIEKRAPFVAVYEMLKNVREKPSKPIVERPEVEFDADKLERLQSRLELLKQFADVYDTLQDVVKLNDEQRERAERAEEHVQKLNSIMGEISDLTTKQARQHEIISRLRVLKEKSDVLKEECKDEKILKALVGAYSTSGLKKFMIQRYSKMLEQQVNKYRRMFFSEDYEFEFRYESGLKVIAHRHYGKRTESSDVRKLSGAEKRFFTLLLVVATNTMLPAKKRINVLILDEPESQMGPPAIERFVKTLSVLNKLVPHIVIVTPKTDLEIPGSRTFTVIKHNGVSTLTRDVVQR
jgi:DNA repair exonuclease SbcCD ATPase subunit